MRRILPAGMDKDRNADCHKDKSHQQVIKPGRIDEPECIQRPQNCGKQRRRPADIEPGRVFVVFAQFPQIHRARKISRQHHNAGNAEHRVPRIARKIYKQHKHLHQTARNIQRNRRCLCGVFFDKLFRKRAVFGRCLRNLCRYHCPRQPACQYRNQQADVHDIRTPFADNRFQNRRRRRIRQFRQLFLVHNAVRQD